MNAPMNELVAWLIVAPLVLGLVAVVVAGLYALVATAVESIRNR